MIHPTRAELLRQLERASELAPDVRFGQMVLFLAEMADDPNGRGLWNLDDAELVEAVRRHNADLTRRQQDAA